MGELQKTQDSAGLYSRLLQRLAIALDDAQSVQGLATTEPQELELRGLTPAELGLINAYLERDLSWLRGWHAAAKELSTRENLPVWSARLKIKPRLRPFCARRGQLCCALCGNTVSLQAMSRVFDCQVCGSKLFRLERAQVH
ncbi:hypothetical protein [Pseudomonas sp. M30-35]|uniref:hypothetical protein n=1 Tax=Pseudomonas sp. M30-35 TaxID=1981174 RepID=UPI000B3BE428|nr:hypothetical protein [Pseudomonas sp. M30-35]ARU87207.1 hypothetical protein B9K09_04065 [Pseudomonas sp. M30-35]